MAVNDPHDKYFRAVMQHSNIAKQFLQWFLPQQLKDILDLDSLTLIDHTYVDSSLNKYISDVVFNCRYKLNNKENDKEYHHSQIVILIEHQSSPEKFMPIRVYNYLFNILNRHAQDEKYLRGDKLLPAIYPMVFYHGQTRKYPYTMNVLKCVENPMDIMHNLSLLNVQLININELSQREVYQQGLVGIMTDAMRRRPAKEHSKNYVSIFSRLGELAKSIKLPSNFTRATVEYMMNVKSISNFDQLIEQSECLSQPMKGDIMTIAEQLRKQGEKRGEKRGEERGILKNKLETAIAMLKEGLDQTLIARTTKLELSQVEELSVQLKNS